MITQWKDKDKLTLTGKQLREFAKLNYNTGRGATLKRILELIDKEIKEYKGSMGNYLKRLKKSIEVAEK